MNFLFSLNRSARLWFRPERSGNLIPHSRVFWHPALRQLRDQNEVFMKCTCRRIQTFLCTWVWSRCSGMESSLTRAPARWKRMELPGTPQVEPCWSSCYKSVIFYLTMISSGKNTIEFLLNNLDILSLSSTHRHDILSSTSCTMLCLVFKASTVSRMPHK